MENSEIQKMENTGLNVFSSAQNFELAQRVAKSLASSSLVPKAYQNNVPNTLIALEMASRIGASPLMVMQHLDIIQGKPSWSSTFLISAINSSGKFSNLQFELKEGTKKQFKYVHYTGFRENRKGVDRTIELNDLSCIAWAYNKNKEKLESPEINMQMALDEGWYDKDGSKWKTMPKLMICYRAAAFFSRLYCPEITMGMQTVEEVIDVVPEKVKTVDTPNPFQSADTGLAVKYPHKETEKPPITEEPNPANFEKEQQDKKLENQAPPQTLFNEK